MSEAVPAQRRLIDDASSWVLALCGRQCGKGWSVARMLVLTAMSRPDSVCIYARRTLGLAKTTMWLQEPVDGIPAVLRSLGLVDRDDPNRASTAEWHYELNLSETSVRFANGSVIRLVGVERQAGWSDVRGHKFVLFVLDEMQEQEEAGLVQALTSDLPYCMMRYGGRFVGIGTPGHVAVGRFHDICHHVREPKTGVDLGEGWEVHRWTAEALRDRTPVWAGLLAWKSRFRIPDTHPKWRRDGLGEWAPDAEDLMLHLGENALWDGGEPPATIADVNGRPIGRAQAPSVYAGLDFGFSAPAGLVVASVSQEEGVLRELWSGKRSGLVTRDLAAWMREVMSANPTLVRFYGDHEDPGKIEELRREYGLPVEPCDKRDYEFMLGEMRSCVLEGRLRVLRESELHRELKVLQPDPKQLLKGLTRPKGGQEDHLFDALRYVFNAVHSNYVLRPEPPVPPMQAHEDRMVRLAIESARTTGRDGRHLTAGSRRR